MNRLRIAFPLLLSLALIGSACKSGTGTTNTGGGTETQAAACSGTTSSNVSKADLAKLVDGATKSLTGAGATFPAPLYQAWGSKFESDFGIKVNYQSIGSGGGVQQITAKTVDFGASDAFMSDTELAKAGGPILHIPTVLGSVAVSYNLEGVSKLKLAPETLAQIFLGNIKKWNDPKIAADNPDADLPDIDITVIHRSDGSGTTSIFTNYLATVSSEWKTKIGAGKEVPWPVGLGGKGNEGVSALLKPPAAQPGAIGYVELVYASQNGLPVIAIKNESGAFVEPNLRSTCEAASEADIPDDLRFSIVNAAGKGAYPIAGATWLLVYTEQTDEAKGKALVGFLEWALTEGQKTAPELSYAQLPKDLKDSALEKIGQIKFQGTAIMKGGAGSAATPSPTASN
jgi:phosphate transport system substrate-binding protein